MAAYEKTRGPRDRTGRDQSKRSRPAQDRQRAEKRAKRVQQRMAGPHPVAAAPIAPTQPVPQPAATAPPAPPPPAPSHRPEPPPPVPPPTVPPPADLLQPIASAAIDQQQPDPLQPIARLPKTCLRTLLDAMIGTCTRKGDRDGVTLLRRLRTSYRRRELDFRKARRQLIKLVGHERLKTERLQLARTQAMSDERERLQSERQPSWTVDRRGRDYTL